jgi:hypothetical protein
LCLCLPVNAATVELGTYITHILRPAPGFELKGGPPRPDFVLAEQKNLPRMKLGLQPWGEQREVRNNYNEPARGNNVHE